MKTLFAHDFKTFFSSFNNDQGYARIISAKKVTAIAFRVDAVSTGAGARSSRVYFYRNI